MDTVCRLYEVGRQRLAEDEDEEEDQVSGLWDFFLLNSFIEATLIFFLLQGLLKNSLCCLLAYSEGLHVPSITGTQERIDFVITKLEPVPDGPMSSTVN